MARSRWMWKGLAYAAALAAAAWLLEWMDFRFQVRSLRFEVYLTVVAVLFAGLGIALGRALTRRPAARGEFEVNRKAREYLGISDRELELLGMLAAGASNKEIARRASISVNTVKTHLSSLYGKLEVSRRTQAVRKGRELRLIP